MNSKNLYAVWCILVGEPDEMYTPEYSLYTSWRLEYFPSDISVESTTSAKLIIRLQWEKIGCSLWWLWEGKLPDHVKHHKISCGNCFNFKKWIKMSLKIFVVIYSLVPLVGSAAMYEKRGNEPFRTGATFESYWQSYAQLKLNICTIQENIFAQL